MPNDHDDRTRVSRPYPRSYRISSPVHTRGGRRCRVVAGCCCCWYRSWVSVEYPLDSGDPVPLLLVQTRPLCGSYSANKIITAYISRLCHARIILESPRRSFYEPPAWHARALGKILSTSISYTAGVSLPRFTDVPTRGQICAEAPKLVPTLPQTMFAAKWTRESRSRLCTVHSNVGYPGRMRKDKDPLIFVDRAYCICVRYFLYFLINFFFNFNFS